MNILKQLIAWVGTFGNDPNKVAQVAHFLFGFITPLLFLVYFNLNPAWGIIAVILWATPKEFILDSIYEHASFYNNLYDWLGYVGGSILQVTILELTKKF